MPNPITKTARKLKNAVKIVTNTGKDAKTKTTSVNTNVDTYYNKLIDLATVVRKEAGEGSMPVLARKAFKTQLDILKLHKLETAYTTDKLGSEETKKNRLRLLEKTKTVFAKLGNDVSTRLTALKTIDETMNQIDGDKLYTEATSSVNENVNDNREGDSINW